MALVTSRTIKRITPRSYKRDSGEPAVQLVIPRGPMTDFEYLSLDEAFALASRLADVARRACHGDFDARAGED